MEFTATFGLDPTKERTELVKHLKLRGIFQMQRAVDEVAGMLGISRAAVYNYLSDFK